MFAGTLDIARQSIARLLCHWMPDNFTSRKLNQARGDIVCPYSSLPLQGTVAVCHLLPEGWLRKELRAERAKRDRQELQIVAKLASSSSVARWAQEAALYEYDLLHEARMQRLFRQAWQGDMGIVVPMIDAERSDHSVIVMRYIPWKRLCDAGPCSLAVAAAARFFFTSIREHHLLHGDMSETNLLVDPEDPRRVCVLDYGLSRRLSAEEAHELLTVRPQSPISRELLGTWLDPGLAGTAFTPEAWDTRWWPLVLRGGRDGEASGDGVFVRSLVSLTRMACMHNG